MPEILTLCRDVEAADAVRQVAEKLQLRVKNTVEHSLAREWLGMRDFAALVVDTVGSTKDLEDLADMLWHRTPSAYVVVFDPHNTLEGRHGELRIIGAEVLTGSAPEAALSRILEEASERARREAPPFRVLVVEDLDSPRDIICAYVESLGLGEATGVRSAREALSLLIEHPNEFSCVLTDIRMPEMSGRELIEQIRLHGRLMHLPVVVLTAYGTVDCLIECLKAGASGFLVKPPKKGDLRRELARAIRIRAAGASPRLTSHEEAEILRTILLDRGF